MRPAPPAEVNRSLAETYPDAKAELDFRDAFELLVATVLSAQSTDRRVNAVTPIIFARYPDAPALAQATPEDIERLRRLCERVETKIHEGDRYIEDDIAFQIGRAHV